MSFYFWGCFSLFNKHKVFILHLVVESTIPSLCNLGQCLVQLPFILSLSMCLLKLKGTPDSPLQESTWLVCYPDSEEKMSLERWSATDPSRRWQAWVSAGQHQLDQKPAPNPGVHCILCEPGLECSWPPAEGAVHRPRVQRPAVIGGASKGSARIRMRVRVPDSIVGISL